jgi:hypothetical protein
MIQYKLLKYAHQNFPSDSQKTLVAPAWCFKGHKKDNEVNSSHSVATYTVSICLIFFGIILFILDCFFSEKNL